MILLPQIRARHCIILFEHLFSKRHILLGTRISMPFLSQGLEKTSDRVTDSHDNQVVHCCTRGYADKSFPQPQCAYVKHPSHQVMFVSFDLSANYIRISHLKNSIISQSYLTTSLLSTLLDDFVAPVTIILF